MRREGLSSPEQPKEIKKTKTILQRARELPGSVRRAITAGVIGASLASGEAKADENDLYEAGNKVERYDPDFKPAPPIVEEAPVFTPPKPRRTTHEVVTPVKPARREVAPPPAPVERHEEEMPTPAPLVRPVEREEAVGPKVVDRGRKEMSAEEKERVKEITRHIKPVDQASARILDTYQKGIADTITTLHLGTVTGLEVTMHQSSLGFMSASATMVSEQELALFVGNHSNDGALAACTALCQGEKRLSHRFDRATAVTVTALDFSASPDVGVSGELGDPNKRLKLIELAKIFAEQQGLLGDIRLEIRVRRQKVKIGEHIHNWGTSILEVLVVDASGKKFSVANEQGDSQFTYEQIFRYSANLLLQSSAVKSVDKVKPPATANR